ncbi:MAG: ergothioneine biosynthesis protein EgtC [Streptosporangiaceae bacterium]
MRGGGTVNADGFGSGWLAVAPASDGAAGDLAAAPGGAGEAAARRYRRDVPIWADPCLPDLAASISSSAILAAVRSATAGMAVTETACAPFVTGPWMFSHNGVINRWPASVASLAEQLPPAVLMTLEAPTDSAFLWALVRERLRAGQPAVSAVASVAHEVLALAPGSRLNLLLNDGLRIVATTVGHSLWNRQGAGSITVSSEALDPGDGSWQPVPDLCLLDATTTDCSIRPLDEGLT